MKLIEKYLFEEKLGLKYTSTEKGGVYIGLIMIILGVIWMLSNYSSKNIVFWQGGMLSVAGLVISQYFSLGARTRKIKELMKSKKEEKK